MKLNKITKIENYWHNGVRTVVDGISKSHKFFIDLIDVFGEGTEIAGLNTRFTDEETFNWTRPQFNDMYIELFTPKAWKMAKQVIGFYINYNRKTDVFRTIPVLIDNKCLSVFGNIYIVGLNHTLTEEDVYGCGSNSIDFDNQKEHRNARCNGRVVALQINDNVYTKPENEDQFTGFFLELLESLLYINAQGIGTMTHTPPTSLKKKRIKRKGLPLYEYKTLRIVKNKQPKDIKSKTWKQGSEFYTERREHFVRGHMAVYTAEKPLFGNPKLVGPIWISPHVRNKGTKGKIIKDYIIT